MIQMTEGEDTDETEIGVGAMSSLVLTLTNVETVTLGTQND